MWPSKTGIPSGVKLEKMNLCQFPACVLWHFSAGMFASQHSGAKDNFALPSTTIQEPAGKVPGSCCPIALFAELQRTAALSKARSAFSALLWNSQSD